MASTSATVGEAFAEVAERFCSVIEEHQQQSDLDFLRNLERLLPILYTNGCDLPELKSSRSVDRSQDSAVDGRETWKRVYDDLGARLGLKEVYDPYRQKRSVTASLADGLADTYQSVFEGLRFWRNGSASAKREAVRRWHLDFSNHWGEHVTGALRAIYSLLHQHYDEDDEVFDI